MSWLLYINSGWKECSVQKNTLAVFWHLFISFLSNLINYGHTFLAHNSYEGCCVLDPCTDIGPHAKSQNPKMHFCV